MRKIDKVFVIHVKEGFEDRRAHIQSELERPPIAGLIKSLSSKVHRTAGCAVLSQEISVFTDCVGLFETSINVT